MRKQIFITLISISFMVAGCTATDSTSSDTNENTNNADETESAADTNTNTNVDGNANINANAGPESQATPAKEVIYKQYTNKAIGYSLQYPEHWYWRHYIRNEIGDRDSLVDDYFIADRKDIIDIKSENLGEVVVEVSRHELKDFFSGVESFDKKDVKVGGADAARHEGARIIDSGKSQKIIEYQFAKDKKAYRIIYTKVDSTQSEEQIFEKIVSSFAF